MSDTEQLETRAEAQGAGGEAKFWQLQLQLAEEDQREFIKRGDAVIARYRNERDATEKSKSRRFAMLYSNTETLKSAIYAKQAKPDVRRRFSDQDPVGKAVAEIIERALIECSDDYASGEDADSAVESAIEDYLLPGRGVVRIKYEATTAGPEGQEVIADQNVSEEYVYWKDFRHEPARKWNKVTWVAFREKMDRAALVENFPDVGKQVPLNWEPETSSKKKEVSDALKRAEVWEIWDKTTKTRVWVVNGFNKILRKDADPYRLQKFFPVAKPLLALTTNDTLIPDSEFSIYRDQADSLDEIENRIDRLTRALRRRGIYDATVQELKRLAKAADNEFIPVKNWSELASKGGLAKAFEAEDISVIAAVLQQLHEQRDLRIQTIYEVTGISDILRGASNPNETLGAQKIKAQFGGARLKKRQDKVQKWIRDTLRIKAEIIAEHFEPEKLSAITGIPIPMQPDPNQPVQPGQPPQPPAGVQIMQILRDDKLRSYRVDIETDSTVFEDAEQEKQARTELIQGITEFLVAAVPLGGQVPPLMPLLFEILEFGLRGVKAGRTLEDAVEQTKQAVMQMAQQPAPPDPKLEAEKAKQQTNQQKAQLDAAAQQQQHQNDMQKMQLEFQASQAEFSMKMKEIMASMEAMAQKHDLTLEQMDRKSQQIKEQASAKSKEAA